MPADLTARKPKAPNQTRPFGSVTKFPGSSVFSKAHGTTHGHLYRVLTAERPSQSIVDAYAAFLRERNIPWPIAAKVQPTPVKPGKKNAA